MSSHEFLRYAILYLGAALVLVPVAHWLGLGSVLGYLAAGAIIGPSALGFVRSPEQVLRFSEFGVVLLLFLIGLELNPRRLWKLRKPIFGMGGIQIALCGTALAIMGWAFGFSAKEATVLGLGFALSSTALALQLLRERNLHQSLMGEASFAVLLFQDLAVIPILALLPLLAPLSAASGAETFLDRLLPIGKGILAIVAVVFAGRHLVRPVFRMVVGTKLRELFTAFALALVFGVAYLMEAVGLSMALGSFLAGMLLAESEFRHELEVDIEPFKGLLLGLFFISVGMSMELGLLISKPALVLGLTLSLLAVKLCGLYIVARVFRHTRDESHLFAIALGQGGEFAFVLYGVAAQLGILSAAHQGLFAICIALSMTATPFLFMSHEKVWRPWFEDRNRASNEQRLGKELAPHPEGNPVILAGFGRVGQVIGRLLHAQGFGLTVLEVDPGQIETMRLFGWKTFYGDVTRLDLLRAAGADQAKLLILAIDDFDSIKRAVELAREHFPHLKILVRAESRIEAYHFINERIPAVRSTFAPGLEMGEEALKLLGTPAFEARYAAQRFKRYDRVQLHRAAGHLHDLEALVTISAQSREELTRIIATDERKISEIIGKGWG